MRAAQITRIGGPSVIKLVELPTPELTRDGVRIRVKASGLNFADVMMRMGLYPEAPKPPFTPGYEIAGEVMETGAAVKDLKAGDRVVGFTKFGGYTDEIVLPDFYVRRIPDGLSEIEAAGIPVAYCTAWVALMDMARVRKGDRVLVYSAAGGVGSAEVQIAAREGATVVGLVSSLAKADYVKSIGASEVWTYDHWQNAPKSETGTFDVILDSASGKMLKLAFDRLAPAGRVVTHGVSDMVGKKRSALKAIRTLINMPLFPPVKLMMANRGVYGLNMLNLAEHPEVITSALEGVLAGFESGAFKVHVGKTFPIEQAGAAQDHLLSRTNLGKVVLTWSPTA